MKFVICPVQILHIFATGFSYLLYTTRQGIFETIQFREFRFLISDSVEYNFCGFYLMIGMLQCIHAELQYYGTNQLQLKWHTRVLSCERVCLHVLHVTTCVSNIIITNLQPVSMNFMFPHPFLKSSAHVERC